MEAYRATGSRQVSHVHLLIFGHALPLWSLRHLPSHVCSLMVLNFSGAALRSGSQRPEPVLGGGRAEPPSASPVGAARIALAVARLTAINLRCRALVGRRSSGHLVRLRQAKHLDTRARVALMPQRPPRHVRPTSTRTAASTPVPLLLVRRGEVKISLLGRLTSDDRLELFTTDELTAEWVSFADRVAALVIATAGDPLSALGYAVTASVQAPIVVAGPARFRSQARDIEAAGALGFVELPPKNRDIDRLLELLSRHAGPSRVDINLRLLLDPIGRVARYHDSTIQLTQREFALLHCLSTHGGRPVAMEDLYRYVWNEPESKQSMQILPVYIFQLRQKLSRLGLREVLVTIRGFGYALVQPTGRVP